VVEPSSGQGDRSELVRGPAVVPGGGRRRGCGHAVEPVRRRRRRRSGPPRPVRRTPRPPRLHGVAVGPRHHVGEQQALRSGPGGVLAGLPAGQVDVRGVLRPVGPAGLAQQHVAAARQLDQRVALAGVTGVDQRAAAGLEAQRVALDRVVGAHRRHRERPDGELAGGDLAEVVHVEQPVGGRRLEGVADALGRACGAVDRQPRRHAVGVVAAGVGVGDEVDAVVGVQVADVDRVDVQQVDRALQRAERSRAQVDDQAEPVVLDEVARAGRVRPRVGARPARGRSASCGRGPAAAVR
jgi:hypothetical protein